MQGLAKVATFEECSY